MICCLKMIYLHLQDVQLGKNSVQDVERVDLQADFRFYVVSNNPILKVQFLSWVH